MVVHQLLSGAGPHDAVTGQALAWRALFRRWGWRGGDHAAAIVAGVEDRFELLSRLRPAPDDVLVVHYSAFAPRLRDALELPNRTLLVSHNVTPPEYFWEHEPTVALRCAVGRVQLAEFAREADVAAGVSEFNCAELRAAGARRTVVVPILVDREALGAPGEPRPANPRAPSLLFVGRLSPHKRQDEVIRAFTLLMRTHAPAARLHLVGAPLSPAYAAELGRLAGTLAPGAVTIESGLDPEALAARWRQADVFLCLSEHEGFCIPLLEAFHFGVPVVARAAGGVPEVAGDAALLTDGRDLAEVVELVLLAAGDEELRGELRARGRRRLESYDFEATAAKVRAAVEAAAA